MSFLGILKKVMGSNSSSLKEPKFVKEFTTENKNSYDFLYKVLSKKDKPDRKSVV